MKKLHLLILISLFLVSIGNAAEKKIFINEISMGEGWIELYNASKGEVDLRGVYFNDALDDIEHWKFPAGVKIPAGGYLIVWPDEGAGDTHTNWLLEPDDSDFGMWDTDAKTLIESISGAVLSGEASYGRYPDGGDKLGEMEPTKAAPNKPHNK